MGTHPRPAVSACDCLSLVQALEVAEDVGAEATVVLPATHLQVRALLTCPVSYSMCQCICVVRHTAPVRLLLTRCC